MEDKCPGCDGPITFSDDGSGVTVNFHCENSKCEYGKPPYRAR